MGPAAAAFVYAAVQPGGERVGGRGQFELYRLPELR